MAKKVDSTNLGYIFSLLKGAFWKKTDIVQVSIDSTPTASSTNLVESGGVYDFVTPTNEEVFGADTTVTITEQTFPDADLMSYSTAQSLTRSYIPLAIVKPDFSFTLSVAAGAPIKAGVQARDSKTFNGGSIAPYDSGWINPGSSYTASASNFSGHSYIIIATTYVSGNTGLPTLQEIRQYITFTYSYASKTISLRDTISQGTASTMRAMMKKGAMAHRGMHLDGVPENSLDAYRYAGACGFEYAETDFSATSDGYLVLMHDASINATMKNKSDYSSISSTVNVASKTLAELQAGYVLAATDKRYRRTIPLLEDYFKICKQYGMFPIPEIKETGNSQTTIKAAYDMGCEILGEGNFGFCSFSYAFLDYARTLSDKIPLFYIGASILDTVNTVDGRTRNDQLNVWYPQYTESYVTASAIAEYHEAGMLVATWTVPIDQYDAVKKKGVDIIASDYCAPSKMDVGEWVRTDVDFSDLTTDGTVSDDALTLASGQSASWTGSTTWLGGYYIEIIGKGAFTVTAPNLSKAISSVDTDTFVFAGLCDNKTMQVNIAATGASEIQFISFKHWNICNDYAGNPVTLSTDVVTDKSDNTKASTPKSVYDFVKPASQSSQPVGGMEAGVLYNLGVLTGSITIDFAVPIDANVVNEYAFTFFTGATAPTITWPNDILVYLGNCIVNGAPEVVAYKYYEVSVLNGVGIIVEADSWL